MEGWLAQDGSIHRHRFALLHIIDDQNNDWALSVGSLVHSDMQEEDIRRMFPKGALIRIKSTYKMSGMTILVESPDMVEVRCNFSHAAHRLYNNMDPEQLRRQGEVIFSKGRLEAALELYNMSMKKFREQESPDEQSFLGCHVGLTECLLKMERFEEAYEIASAALEIDDRHVKSLILHGKALFHRQEYVLAVVSLSKALEYGGGGQEEPEIQAALDKAGAFVNQSNSGNYRSHIDEAIWNLGKDVPECSDYIGPLEFGRNSHGTRALFASTDIKGSSLVMVSNAIAVATLKPGSDQLQYDLVCKVMRACMNSRELRHQVLELSQLEKPELPSVLMFRPDKMTWGFKEEEYADLRASLEPDVHLVFTTVDMYSSGSFYVSKEGNETTTTEIRCFQLLSSFLTHSCLPNLNALDIGSTSFFHANRDISAGEELTINGLSSVHPFLPRSARFDVVECKCRRCEAEEAYEGKLKNALKVMKKHKEGVADMDDMKACVEAAKLVPEIEKVIEDAQEEHKHFIRTSFAYAYVHFFRLREQKKAVAKVVTNEALIPSPEEVVQAFRHCVPGSPDCLRMIHNLGHKEISSDEVSKMIGNAEEHILAEAARQVFSDSGIFS